MFELQTNHCQIVKDALQGKRSFDEQTLASLSVLDERLKRLKRLDKLFSEVDFSAAVRKLLFEKDTLEVGGR
jgi:hypothetical protein